MKVNCSHKNQSWPSFAPGKMMHSDFFKFK